MPRTITPTRRAMSAPRIDSPYSFLPILLKLFSLSVIQVVSEFRANRLPHYTTCCQVLYLCLLRLSSPSPVHESRTKFCFLPLRSVVLLRPRFDFDVAQLRAQLSQF